MKKIAIFHCGFIYTGGGERIVLEEIAGFRKKGYVVDCFVPTYDPQKSYPDIIEDYGISTFTPQLPAWFPLRYAIQMITSCLIAPAIAKRFADYDYFIGANQPGAYMAWAIARNLGKPYYVYLSQPNRVLYPRDHEDWQNVRDYYFLNNVINKYFKGPISRLDKRSITEGENLFINGSFVAQEIQQIYDPQKWVDVPGVADKVILVDDGSHDGTVNLARKLGIATYSHPQNRGYGGNQKTCYTMALNEGADIIVMIHPDYQYDSSLTGELIKPILNGRYDIMLGSRIRTRREALAGGMPRYKYFANRGLTIMQNIILGQNLSEYHTGFRAFHKKVLRKLPFHKFSDDFIFDQDILISAIHYGYRIGQIDVPVRYFPEASSINFRCSVKYGLGIIWDLGLYLLAANRVYRSPIFNNSK